MKKLTALTLTLLTLTILSACGQSAGFSGANYTPAPPVRLPDTLEAEFDEAYAANPGSSFMSRASIISFPDRLPTEGLTFSTPDRFSISYTIRIAVENTPQAFETLNELPGILQDIHITFDNGQTTYEAVLHLGDIPLDEIENIFTQLYAKGTVEEYSVTVRDMSNTDSANDPEWYQALWDEHNTIAITLVEGDSH